MVGNLQVHLNDKFIVTPKLLSYSQTSPNCKTPPLVLKQNLFSPYSGAIGNSRKQTLVPLATTDEQTSADNLHTWDGKILLNPRIQQRFIRAQHNQRGN